MSDEMRDVSTSLVRTAPVQYVYELKRARGYANAESEKLKHESSDYCSKA